MLPCFCCPQLCSDGSAKTLGRQSYITTILKSPSPSRMTGHNSSELYFLWVFLMKCTKMLPLWNPTLFRSFLTSTTKTATDITIFPSFYVDSRTMNSSCHLGNNFLFLSWSNALANPRLCCTSPQTAAASCHRSLARTRLSQKCPSSIMEKVILGEESSFHTLTPPCKPWGCVTIHWHISHGTCRMRCKQNTAQHSQMSQLHCGNVTFGTPAT